MRTLGNLIEECALLRWTASLSLQDSSRFVALIFPGSINEALCLSVVLITISYRD